MPAARPNTSACPYSDVGPIVIPDGLEDDKVLFLSDILPTGWMAAENCRDPTWRHRGDLGRRSGRPVRRAERVPDGGAQGDLDRPPSTPPGELAKEKGAEVINYHDVKVREALDEMTGGIGPDACIDAVGLESHGFAFDNIIDAVKVATRTGTDRGHVLREVILACRKGGHVSIPGVYGGFIDKFPVGAMMEKGLTIKTGQTHVPRSTCAPCSS